MSRLLAIDPGTEISGWAAFYSKKLVDSGVLTARGEDWVERSDDVVGVLVLAARDRKIMTVVMEEPQQYASGGKGGAARNSGAILKLFAMAHMLRSALLRETGVTVVHMILPAKWKGQVPKEITRMRMVRRWGDVFGELDDETDAAGLGTWWLEKRKGRKR